MSLYFRLRVSRTLLMTVQFTTMVALLRCTQRHPLHTRSQALDLSNRLVLIARAEYPMAQRAPMVEVEVALNMIHS